MTEQNTQAPNQGWGLEALFFDRKAVEEGQWVDDIKGFPGLRVLTRGWNCSDATILRDVQASLRPPHLVEGSEEYEAAKAADPLAHKRQLQERNKEERSELLLKVLTKDWVGLAGIPFTPENLRIICQNDQALGARQVLISAALQCGQINAQRGADQIKNFVAGLGISFGSPELTQGPSTT